MTNNNTYTRIYDDAMTLLEDGHVSYGDLFDLSDCIVENYLNGNLTTEEVKQMIEDGLTSEEIVTYAIRSHYEDTYAGSYGELYPMHNFEEEEPELYYFYLDADYYTVEDAYRREEERMAEEAEDEEEYA